MKILHLYHDIMNLYGDYANISAIERMLTKSGIEVEIDRLSLADNPNFETYDFVYIGSGTENNQKLVLADFEKYADQLKAYIESGKPMLMTGNSFEMLGKTITDCNDKVYDGLGIANFTTTEQNKKRVTGDVIYKADFLEKPLVGFINKCSEINGIENPLFNVEMGLSDNSDSKNEGIVINNLYGTHLTGPVLIKNPAFLEHIANIIIKPYNEYKLCTDYLNYENAGYEVTLTELRKRMENMA